MADAVQSQNSLKRNVVTHERLTELLHYDPDTGIFNWRVKTRSKFSPGDVAGHKLQRGYVGICVDCKMYKAHRLAWFYVHKEWPEKYVDHINGTTSDNRIANLRPANTRENCQNRRAVSGKKLGLPKGVIRKPGKKSYTAVVALNGQYHYLGVFPTPDEAHAAYSAKAKELFGEFARLA